MSLTHLGRYEITGTLGRGAMGVVYKARDPLIERVVAIKTVACAGLPEKDAKEFEERFFREAKSAGRLNHPNIVTIHDVGHDGELAYIAMEFLSGRSLRETLDAGTPLSLARAVDIAAAVADGLAFAHAQGIVHRDVKPANIMILDNGSVKIADFGIAQLPGGSLTLAGSVLGSPKHMSPEQVAGEKADGRSDIFSLGTVLYEMLTGHPPFSGDNMHATMYQVLHKTPPPPSGCCPGVPQVFDAIVARALAKNPAERYQSAGEMAADLRRALHASAETQPGNAPAAAPAAATRKRWARHAIAVVAAGAIAGAGLVLLRPTAPSQPAAATSAPPEPSAATPRPTGSAPQSAEPAPPPREPAATKGADSRDRTPVATTPAKRWEQALQIDLKACDTLSVFRKVLCIEKARWKHCPGHWGEIDDCPSSMKERRTAP